MIRPESKFTGKEEGQMSTNKENLRNDPEKVSDLAEGTEELYGEVEEIVTAAWTGCSDCCS